MVDGLVLLQVSVLLSHWNAPSLLTCLVSYRLVGLVWYKTTGSRICLTRWPAYRGRILSSWTTICCIFSVVCYLGLCLNWNEGLYRCIVIRLQIWINFLDIWMECKIILSCWTQVSILNSLSLDQENILICCIADYIDLSRDILHATGIDNFDDFLGIIWHALRSYYLWDSTLLAEHGILSEVLNRLVVPMYCASWTITSASFDRGLCSLSLASGLLSLGWHYLIFWESIWRCDSCVTSLRYINLLHLIQTSILTKEDLVLRWLRAFWKVVDWDYFGDVLVWV